MMSNFDFVTSKVLLFLVIGLGTEKNKVLTDRKLFLIFYFAQRRLAKEDIFNPSYKFFRYKSGVFSRELYRDIHKLADSRLVEIGDNSYQVTHSGWDLFKNILNELRQDKDWKKVVSALEAGIEISVAEENTIVDFIKDFAEGEFLFRDNPGNLVLPGDIAETFLYAYDLINKDIAEMNRMSDVTTKDVLDMI